MSYENESYIRDAVHYHSGSSEEEQQNELDEYDESEADNR